MKKILLSFIVLITLLSSLALAKEINYAIIVDAGSTGSRIHLFHFYENNNFFVIEEKFSKKTEPGLSSFVEQPEQASASLKVLFDALSAQIKLYQIDSSKIPVFVWGTAGMRLLPIEKQQLIYENVKSFIQKNYSFASIEVETISGNKEGIFGWLDVNYLAQTFQKKEPTIGAIDVGGASTQITFESTIPSQDEINLKINGKSYLVFSKSFLGLGLEQALLAMNKSPLALNCYPFNYPITTGIQKNNINQDEYLHKDANKSLGNFNFNACDIVYENFLHENEELNNLSIPKANDFIAFSGAYYNYKFFDVMQMSSSNEIKNKIEKICDQSWEELQNNYPSQSLSYLAHYCADGVYLYHLFYQTYGLQTAHLKVKKEINGKEIDWALGALLYQLLTAVEGKNL